MRPLASILAAALAIAIPAQAAYLASIPANAFESGRGTRIAYVLSTWNPYVVVLMSSEFDVLGTVR